MSTTALRRLTNSALLRQNFRFLSTSSSSPPPPPPPPRPKRSLGTLAAVVGASLVAGTLGAIYPPPPISILFPRAAPGPPADPESHESQAYSASLEEQLQTLPYLQDLRKGDATEEWYETRPYQGFPEERRVNNLTAGALRGPGKLAVVPLIRAKRDETESVVIIHLGRGLCGHDGIVHGGMLATLLDETLARTAISNLPEKVGVTATLSLSYRAPTMADQFIVIKTKLGEVKGRKAFVSGSVEDLKGTVLVEASAMFVQPRYAKLLHSAQLRKAMGEPPATSPKEPVLLADGQDLNPGHRHR
ncbi:hypothetical protein D9619_003773 [Psilocybe cf. subviscida]|uniref:Thioesterase domain-containing protein n=1 Tax=Psilocybe cf. subviscida TaxID=2480587 RepID=A0A8H5AWI7_9AGAR|nr:hypothetical protein D9619_003773 [Psilocybe cf. subviscida]